MHPVCNMLRPVVRSRLSAVARARWSGFRVPVMGFHSASRIFQVLMPKMSDEDRQLLTLEREADEVDVCIVGGGPAGLAAAIKFKQLDTDDQYRVVVLEKAGDFGSHTVSGAVIEPRALQELFPDEEHVLPPDLTTLVTSDSMKYLTEEYAFPLPEPPQMVNAGKNYIVSLSEVVKYLAEKAEELGVEMYPGIAVSELVYNDNGSVKGVATKDMGVGKDGVPKDSFERGMEFHTPATVLAEGCHGSLTKSAIAKFGLRDLSDPQTYGLGIKEVWEVAPENFEKGYVGHTMGYPLLLEYGGGFMYHFGDGMVAVGLVIGLDYENPYVSPYQEFQRMKLHPYYANVLRGGKCISYAARALNEGGFQSVPQLYFPGGVLVGCSAGFLNVPKIKGTHTAMKTGMLAAENIYQALAERQEDDEAQPLVLKSYQEAYENSWVHEELQAVRNVRPSFQFGFLPGLAHSGVSTFFNGIEPWTLHHQHTDSAATKPASQYAPKEYPKPDNELTFDIMTSVSRTGTYHDEDEQCHLRIPGQDYEKHANASYPIYKGVESRFCPAGVYEYVEDDTKELGVKFNINAQNCIHCKTCDIKVPTQDIDWQVPEGGDGPKYSLT